MSNSAAQEIVYNPEDYPAGMVAVPSMQWMWTKSAESLLHLTTGLPPGTGVSIADGSLSSIAAVRNGLVREFLEHPAAWRWILFVDSDMVVPPFAAMRLLSHNLDIVSGFYVMRQPPYLGAFGALKENANQLYDLGRLDVAPYEIEYAGGGCLLIRRTVLERMPEPWFEHSVPGLGEDFVFCQKARALGYPIYLDTALLCGHVDVRAATAADSVAYQSAVQRERPTPDAQQRFQEVRAKNDAAAAAALDRMRSELAVSGQAHKREGSVA